MSIVYVTGDATRPVGEGDKVIVHICNNIGKWGAGFVKAISARWAGPERDYRYRENPKTLGTVRFVQVEPDIFVANMIAQHGIGRANVPIRYDSLEECLWIVEAFVRARKLSIHMPRIGTGLAGATWDRIEPIIQRTLVDQGVSVTVYDLPA